MTDQTSETPSAPETPSTADLSKPKVFATPAGVPLCLLSDLTDPGARGLVLELRAGMFHGFVVRKGDQVFGYVDRCPHAGLPLVQELDQYLTRTGDYLMCSWHGALFEIKDGLCVGGPCAGRSLMPWPVKVEGGMVVTAG